MNCATVRTRFAAKTFTKMSKLRFLYLDNVDLTGSFKHTFKDLRWLCWWGCPLKCLPSEFYPQKLVSLALPRSKIRTLWELNMVGTDTEFLVSMIICINVSNSISSNCSYFYRFRMFLTT